MNKSQMQLCVTFGNMSFCASNAVCVVVIGHSAAFTAFTSLSDAA